MLQRPDRPATEYTLVVSSYMFKIAVTWGLVLHLERITFHSCNIHMTCPNKNILALRMACFEGYKVRCPKL